MNSNRNTKSQNYKTHASTHAGERKAPTRQLPIGANLASAYRGSSTAGISCTVKSSAATKAVTWAPFESSTSKIIRSETSSKIIKSDISRSIRAYRTRRSAGRIIAKFGSIDPKELTEDEKGRLAWAHAHINVRPADLESKDVVLGKRPRSPEQTAETAPQSSKRLKNVPSRPKLSQSVSKDFQDSLTIAVVDNSHPEGTITATNWKLVEMALLNVFIEVMSANPGPSPQCRDAGWFQGHIKKIACSDFRSMELYKAAIRKVGEVWPGAKLDVVPLDQIPRRPRSKARIPAEPSTPKEILQILKRSNTDMPTDGWRVVKVSEVKNNYREAIIVLNEQSLPLIKARNGEINYGFGSIPIRVYKSDAQMAEQMAEARLQTPLEQPCSSNSVRAETLYDNFDSASRSSFNSSADSDMFEDYWNAVQPDFDPAYATSEDEQPYTAVMALESEGHRNKLARF